MPAGLDLAVLFLLGIITGGLSNVTSGGAGVFTIFFLTQYLGLVIQESTGTVLAASTVIVLVGAISFWRKGQVDRQLAMTVGLSGVAAAFVAAKWAAAINSGTLKAAFGAFTLALAFYTAARLASEIRSKRRAKSGQAGGTAPSLEPRLQYEALGQPTPQPSRWTGTDPLSLAVQVAKGVGIGLATGLFGVGLASLSIVLFLLLFRLDMRVVLGTSLFASFMRYLGGSVGYLSSGLIDPFYFVIIALGGTIGSFVGARIILRGEGGSKDVYVKIIVIGVLLFVSFEFLLKGAVG